jgi:membrane associated rhomboid family serine protease
MNWINQLERKFGRFAIPGLMYYIIILNAIVYFFMYLDKTGTVYGMLTLDPMLVMQGQIWRLVTYIFIPPSASLLFIVFVLLFYYTVGVGLEQEWGTFKFNFYYLLGMIATSIAAFYTGVSSTAVYLNLSLFLAFAYLFPHYEILLFMILPIKVKYLAWLDLAWIGYTIVMDPVNRFLAIASLANFIVFFGSDLVRHTRQRREVYDNRKRFENAANNYVAPVHVCEYCGMTEKTDPNMTFHHCPDCDPEYEYCSKHIKIHQHVKRMANSK